MDRAAYYVALDGVTRYALAEAVKAILRGSLGHAFLPSPPELRIACDKAMEHHAWERQHIARREQVERERREHAVHEPSPESKARVAAAYARFCERYGKTKAEETLRLDPDLVSQVADNPKSIARQRMGKA